MEGDAQWSSQIMEENSRLNGQLTHYKKKCSDQQAEIDELVEILIEVRQVFAGDDWKDIDTLIDKHKGE